MQFHKWATNYEIIDSFDIYETPGSPSKHVQTWINPFHLTSKESPGLQVGPLDLEISEIGISEERHELQLFVAAAHQKLVGWMGSAIVDQFPEHKSGRQSDIPYREWEDDEDLNGYIDSDGQEKEDDGVVEVSVKIV